MSQTEGFQFPPFLVHYNHPQLPSPPTNTMKRNGKGHEGGSLSKRSAFMGFPSLEGQQHRKMVATVQPNSVSFPILGGNLLRKVIPSHFFLIHLKAGITSALPHQQSPGPPGTS